MCSVGVIVLVAWHGSGIDALVWSLLAGLAAQTLVVLIAVRGARNSPSARAHIAGDSATHARTVALPCCSACCWATNTGVRSDRGRYAPYRRHSRWVMPLDFTIRSYRPSSCQFQWCCSALWRLLAEGKKRRTARTLERVVRGHPAVWPWPRWYLSRRRPLLIQVLLERGHFTAETLSW